MGVGASLLAYKYIILPNRSLIPNLETAGNELWLAIFAFLYAVANKIPLSGGPGDRRRNEFIRRHYEEASRRFGPLIDRKIENEILKLTAYSILIYEDYSRPSAIRSVERLMTWKPRRTTGIMQVTADRALSDRGSDMSKSTVSNRTTAKPATDIKKSSAFEQLLTRECGASLDELTAASGWQPHSCRAFLTGLRKKGWIIERGRRDDGTTVWTGRAPATSEQAQN